jgi:hypothetical protein
MKAIITPVQNGFHEIIYQIGIATNEDEVLFQCFLLRPAFSQSTAYRWRNELQREIDQSLFLFSEKQKEILKQKGIAL